MIDLDWTGQNRLALLTVDSGGKYIVWTVSPAGQDLRRVHVGDEPLAGLCSLPDGRTLYTLRNRSEAAELMGLRADAGPDVPAEVVLGGVPVVFSATSILDCSVSRDGDRLLYSRGSAYANLWTLEIDKKGALPAALTRGSSLFSNPAVSPDGRWIAATVGTEANSQIVRIPTGGGEPVRLRPGGPPSWSPDGKRLAFTANEGGAQRVLVSDMDGQGAIQVRGPQPANPHMTWLPDGRLARQTPDGRDYRIESVTDVSTAAEGFQNDKPVGFIFSPRFSPRGDRVALFWNRQQQRGLWVMTWPGKVARALAPELTPFAWSLDGEWIYARNERRDVFRVSARTAKSETVATFSSGTLEAGCDITPDSEDPHLRRSGTAVGCMAGRAFRSTGSSAKVTPAPSTVGLWVTTGEAPIGRTALAMHPVILQRSVSTSPFRSILWLWAFTFHLHAASVPPASARRPPC